MKNAEIVCNYRRDLLGLLSPIGPALAIFSFLVLSPEIPSDDFSGRVVSISDGDTISVIYNGRTKKVRLNGIDAPEKGQAFGNRAKQFVSAMAFGKVVKVEAKGRDRYGRTVADVIFP